MSTITKEFYLKLSEALNVDSKSDKYLGLYDLLRDPETTPAEKRYIKFLMNTTYGFMLQRRSGFTEFHDPRKAQEITETAQELVKNFSVLNAETLSDLYPHIVDPNLLSKGGVDQHVTDDLAEDYMSNDAVYRYADELHGRTMDLLRGAQYEGLNTNDLKDRIKFCEAVMEMAHQLESLDK